MPANSSAASPSAAATRASPALRALLRWGGRLLLLAYFTVALLILLGRHFVLPGIDQYRGAIERQLSGAIGLPVRIAAVSASWPGLHPQLSIDGLQIHDRAGRPALAFDHVEAVVGWSSLWHFSLHLHRLEIIAPVLDIRRDHAGVLFVAGLPVQGTAEDQGGFADWLLAQSRIVVRDARLVWHDDLRAAPALELQHLSLDLRNAGRHHSFGLVAEPTAGMATRIDLRGNLIGRDLADLANWRGELYADLDQADLAVWSPWLDIPFEAQRGKGGLRLWLNFENLLPKGFTADLRLADVAVRLQPKLPLLELQHLHGRMIGQRTASGYVGEIRRLELATRDGIAVAPTDARLQLDLGGRREGGEFRANGFDLGALAALAGYLPLPPDIHERLQTFNPRGQLADLTLKWQGALDAPTHWTSWQVNGRFADLALAPYRELPGFSGISGRLEGDESAGQVRVESHAATLELPTVFADPQLELTHLRADLGWQQQGGKQQGNAVDLLLSRISFENRDASGEIAGRYRYTGSGPGEIDLTAKLTRGAGNAVWRYLPVAVGQITRDWLRSSIIGGRSDNTTLRLKGPLAKFPFKDGQHGIFQVKGTFQGATLKYADSWPEISAIDGDLLFEGVHMRIRGQRGTLMGVALAGVSAEIADLEAPEELLVVTGRAKGATQQFLDFIEASPVGERIDHFTQAMRASGKGDLDLKLVLPLRRLDDAQVQGRYRFADNQLRVMPELPPFTGAQGEFSFTADRLQAKNLRARLFGLPLALDVTSAAGGVVNVAASGTLTAQGLRQEYGHPLLDHLSGETAWRATVTVKKPGAEVRFESNVEGLSSSLPEPFNKSARDALPLKLEGHIGAQRDDWTATLGGNAALHLQQTQTDGQWRGRVALGAAAVKAAAPLPLPAAGVALAIAQPQLDVDAWREVLAQMDNGNGNGTSNNTAAVTTTKPLPQPPSFQLAMIDLKSAGLHAWGRNFHDIQLSAKQLDQRWRIAVDSREAQGQLTWEGSGAGRITGRMARLTLPASELPAATQAGSVGDTTQELPAIELVVDNFRLHDMALGEVHVAAENHEGAWQAKLAVKNEAARLSGEGHWRPSRTAPETALAFKLEVGDAEKLLGYLGLPDAVRRGTAHLDGNLTWAGAPFALDLPSLSGTLKVVAEKGQFKKLEPGVGRLLGVLSLQSLPRRITLDFRDIFSEGYAFDNIAGTATISRGLISTEGLTIHGPQAKVLLTGQANLTAETQNLKVRVQPAVGESIAVGAMIIASPVAGAVAWAAQKLLNDPLDRAFAFEYAVTGDWSDPQVKKLGRNPAIEPPASTP